MCKCFILSKRPPLRESQIAQYIEFFLSMLVSDDCIQCKSTLTILPYLRAPLPGV